MADIGDSTWSEIDANNNSASPLGMPANMAPSGVDPWARASMGAIKRWYDWSIPKTTAGTTTAYTLTYAQAPDALNDGMTHCVRFNAANGTAPTLNVNGLGALPLYFYSGSAWAAFPTGIVQANQIVECTYDATSGTYRAVGLTTSIPYVSAQSVSGVSTVDFTGIPSNINHLECFFALTPTASVQFFLQVYAASVLDAGANYFYTINTGQSGVISNIFANPLTGIPLNTNVVSASNVFSGDFSMTGIQAAAPTNANFRDTYISGGAANTIQGAGTHNVSTAVNGIRILVPSGTMSGTITLRGFA